MLVLSFLLASALISACSDEDNSTGPGSSYTDATITHWGFDFSAAKQDTTSDWNTNQNDGDVISWPSIGESSINGLWFRTRIEPNRTQSLGIVDISSVTSIDTLSEAWDTQPPPLSKDNVVIAQCLDGFVKFKVVAEVDTSEANDNWAVQVQYLFSTTPSFPE